MIDLVIQAAKAENEYNSQVPGSYNRMEEAMEAINPIYAKTVKKDKRMSVHFDGHFPDFLFSKAAPNEDPESWRYRKEIYQPVTMPPTGRALAATGRIWNPTNYSVNIKDDYLVKSYPGYGSLLNYFVQTFHPRKFAWANAVQVLRPRMIPTKKNAQGQDVVDPSAMLEPIAIIIPASNVVDFNEEFVLVKSENMAVVVQPDGRKKRTGRIYELYNKDTIIRYTETTPERWPEPTFFEEPLFNADGHGLGYIPAIKLKGRPCKSVEGRMIYDSYFAPALPQLECALINHSTLQMSEYTQAFPRYWEMTDKCNYPGCINGTVREVVDGNTVPVKCPNCQGDPSNGPIITTEVNVRDEDGKAVPFQKPFGWEAPDATILTYLSDKVEKRIELGYAMLNIDISHSNVKGSDTALGKMIDRDELISFLQSIANELFGAFTWTANTLGRIRNRAKWEEVNIPAPRSFQVRGTADLLEEIGNPNLPPLVRKDSIREYIALRFTSDSIQQKINTVIESVDRLYLMAPEAVRVLQSSIKPEFITLHDYALKYIQDELRKNEGFLDNDMEEIEKVLMALALADVKEESFSPLFDAGGGRVTWMRFKLTIHLGKYHWQCNSLLSQLQGLMS